MVSANGAMTIEPLGIYAAPSVLVKPLTPTLTPALTIDQLLALPHFEYTRANLNRTLKLPVEAPAAAAHFSDFAAMREACCAGFGWAVLPRYMVQRELRAGLLIELHTQPILPDRYGVWWLRESSLNEATIQRAAAWLKQQVL